MNTYNEEVQNSAYNPFPEPQTIPSGWDLSEILITPQAALEMDDAELEKGHASTK